MDEDLLDTLALSLEYTPINSRMAYVFGCWRLGEYKAHTGFFVL